MTKKFIETLAEELLAWRATLLEKRSANLQEVDIVISHIDASIESINALRSADMN